jgi:hypothetical protein
MEQRTTKMNPSEETIKIGPLGIRFLLTGDDSNSNMSVFEVLVPAGQKLAAPPDRAKMMEVFRRHGKTMIAPPLNK